MKLLMIQQVIPNALLLLSFHLSESTFDIESQCLESYIDGIPSFVQCKINTATISSLNCALSPDLVLLTFTDSRGLKTTIASGPYSPGSCLDAGQKCRCLDNSTSVYTYKCEFTPLKAIYDGGSFMCSVNCLPKGVFTPTENHTSCETTRYGLQMPCEIPSVPLGHPTILTCHYNENILESKERIFVIHYSQNEDVNPEIILFNSFPNDKMEFHTLPDYVLQNISGKIQVMIPQVTQKHVGRYVCLALESNYHEECTFTLKDIVNKTQTTVTISLEMTFFPNAENEMNQDVIRYLFIIILLGFTLLLCILTIVVMKRKRSEPCYSYTRICGCIYCTGCKTAKEEANMTNRTKTRKLNDEDNVMDSQEKYVMSTHTVNYSRNSPHNIGKRKIFLENANL